MTLKPHAASAPAVAGTPTTRAWRNKNPLNVMPLALPAKWTGQTGLDAQGYAVFDTAADGWAAGYRNLMSYQTLHGIDTIAGIAARWAPTGTVTTDVGNNPSAYATAVANLSGYSVSQVLNLQDYETLLVLGLAMSIEEGGHLPWLLADRETGLQLVGLKPPGSPGPVAPTPPITTPSPSAPPVASGPTFPGLVDANNDAAAAAHGVAVGQIYRNGSQLMIRVS